MVTLLGERLVEKALQRLAGPEADHAADQAGRGLCPMACHQHFSHRAAGAHYMKLDVHLAQSPDGNAGPRAGQLVAPDLGQYLVNVAYLVSTDMWESPTQHGDRLSFAERAFVSHFCSSLCSYCTSIFTTF